MWWKLSSFQIQNDLVKKDFCWLSWKIIKQNFSLEVPKWHGQSSGRYSLRVMHWSNCNIHKKTTSSELRAWARRRSCGLAHRTKLWRRHGRRERLSQWLQSVIVTPRRLVHSPSSKRQHLRHWADGNADVSRECNDPRQHQRSHIVLHPCWACHRRRLLNRRRRRPNIACVQGTTCDVHLTRQLHRDSVWSLNDASWFEWCALSGQFLVCDVKQ